MGTRTFTAQVGDNGSQTIITFYREIPGGWKLDLRNTQGQHVANGDRWVETIDDLVLQLGNFTDDDLMWHTEEDEPVSFYAAVKECTLHSQIT
ncbi:MAG: hypothetical protein CMN68_01115 [Sphingomonadaceae bacterium]|nr:hypothetical protein [Sphingomonadaceae bacterium]HBR83482.1 hypothetical protein [Erythrobacter sp.]|tara:strand:+ start:177 stop:455 length:279 start_codon:yes stop_codon:yes gene_type:complete